MNEYFIENDEILYRACTEKNLSEFINGKPSPAFFIDSGGLSVDRDGRRDEVKIINTLVNRFKKAKYICSVKLQANICKEIGTHPLPKPSKNNKYHAEIHKTAQIIEIDLFTAMRLAQCCEVI